MADITMSGSGATYLAGVQKSVEVDLSGSGKVFIDAQGQVPFICCIGLLRMNMSFSKLLGFQFKLKFPALCEQTAKLRSYLFSARQ